MTTDEPSALNMKEEKPTAKALKVKPSRWHSKGKSAIHLHNLPY